MNIIIKNMEIQDLDQVVLIEKECFSEAWTRNGFQTAIDNKDNIFLVALDDDRLLGYVGMYVSFDDGEITNVAVSRDYRKKGIGRKLLWELFNNCQERGISCITLEVRASNEPAIGLYEKMGFEALGFRKDFYSFPKEDALIMQKHL